MTHIKHFNDNTSRHTDSMITKIIHIKHFMIKHLATPTLDNTDATHKALYDNTFRHIDSMITKITHIKPFMIIHLTP